MSVTEFFLAGEWGNPKFSKIKYLYSTFTLASRLQSKPGIWARSRHSDRATGSVGVGVCMCNCTSEAESAAESGREEGSATGSEGKARKSQTRLELLEWREEGFRER